MLFHTVLFLLYLFFIFLYFLLIFVISFIFFLKRFCLIYLQLVIVVSSLTAKYLIRRKAHREMNESCTPQETNEPSTREELNEPCTSKETNEPCSSEEDVPASALAKRRRTETRALAETSSDDEVPPAHTRQSKETFCPTARKGPRVFTSRETSIIGHATRSLKNNATKKEIILKLKGDEDALAYNLVPGERFTEQQLRDKFKSIRRYK